MPGLRSSRTIIRYLFCLWLCGIALSHAVRALSAENLVLVLGDSLSAAHNMETDRGWVHLLQQKIAGEKLPYRVVNASISGETTGGGLARLPELLDQHHPRFLLLELGANDGLRGYPIKVMKKNLSSIIRSSQQHGVKVIVIGVQIPINYGPRYTRLFEASFRELSEQYSTELIPSLLGNIPLDDSLMQEDRLHPNARAQPLILQNVWPTLQPLLAHGSLKAQGESL
jgi:acyl-CoA thioesterase-1